MSAGFAWSGFIKATNSSCEVQTVFAGNFVMKLILPNALKLTSFTKLRDRLERYVASHGGHYPDYIRINRRQYQEYGDLFPATHLGMKLPPIPTFQGIPMKIYALQ